MTKSINTISLANVLFGGSTPSQEVWGPSREALEKLEEIIPEGKRLIVHTVGRHLQGVMAADGHHLNLSVLGAWEPREKWEMARVKEVEHRLAFHPEGIWLVSDQIPILVLQREVALGRFEGPCVLIVVWCCGADHEPWPNLIQMDDGGDLLGHWPGGFFPEAMLLRRARRA